MGTGRFGDSGRATHGSVLVSLSGYSAIPVERVQPLLCPDDFAGKAPRCSSSSCRGSEAAPLVPFCPNSYGLGTGIPRQPGRGVPPYRAGPSALHRRKDSPLSEQYTLLLRHQPPAVGGAPAAASFRVDVRVLRHPPHSIATRFRWFSTMSGTIPSPFDQVEFPVAAKFVERSEQRSQASAVQPRDMKKEFEEVAHSGGKITFNVVTTEDGIRAYQTEFRANRPVPSKLVGVYALPQGIVLDCIELRGLGQPWNPPPTDGCIPVLIASDSEGHFGHKCPRCGRYWRSGPWPNFCPYCASPSLPHHFLSEAQQRYVRHYCNTLVDAIDSAEDGEVQIDMDIVANAAGCDGEKPPFYVSEESQQQKFTCLACNEFNDILGRLGYCSKCRTRNDLSEFENQIIPDIREQLNTGSAPEDCVRDAVALFDSLSRQVGRELARLVPMSQRRRERLSKQGFYDLYEVAQELRDWFDIEIFSGIGKPEQARTILMFHRRHVYEHNAGEVDQKYLDDSGDPTVRLRQHIHESREGVHDFLGSLVKMFRNLHHGFHEMFPPLAEPIRAFEDKTRRMSEDRDDFVASYRTRGE